MLGEGFFRMPSPTGRKSNMTEKFSKDGAFTDLVLRCDSCSRLVLLTQLHELGMCPHCGNRKVRNVLVFNDAEMAWMKKQEIDADFIALFTPVVAAGGSAYVS